MAVSISLPKPNRGLCRIKSLSYGDSGSSRNQIDINAVGGADSVGAVGFHQLHRPWQPFSGRAIRGQRAAVEQDAIGEAVFSVLLVLRRVSARGRMARRPL